MSKSFRGRLLLFNCTELSFDGLLTVSAGVDTRYGSVSTIFSLNLLLTVILVDVLFAMTGIFLLKPLVRVMPHYYVLLARDGLLIGSTSFMISYGSSLYSLTSLRRDKTCSGLRSDLPEGISGSCFSEPADDLLMYTLLIWGSLRGDSTCCLTSASWI